MEWPRLNERQAGSYRAEYEMCRGDIRDMQIAEFEALGASLEWPPLNENERQARRAEAEALAGRMEWQRLNESQLRSYRAEYGMHMSDMPFMGMAEFEALSACLGWPSLNDRRAQSGIDVSQGMMAGYTDQPNHRGHEERVMDIFHGIRNRRNLNFAKAALEFYERSQGAEFEMVEVLYSEYAEIVVPKVYPDLGLIPPSLEEWSHVSFTAKPKNADVSPKYFFGELLKDKLSGTFNAAYCSTFEPSDDPGFNHGCVFCPVNQKFHPGPGGYRGGRPPCYVMQCVYI